jgi:hypothetical protein
MAAGMEDCNTQFPEGTTQFVAKNQCQANAAKTVRAFATYPDLFDKYWADRAVTAERLQAGKMTKAEAVQLTAADAHGRETSKNNSARLWLKRVFTQPGPISDTVASAPIHVH